MEYDRCVNLISGPKNTHAIPIVKVEPNKYCYSKIIIYYLIHILFLFIFYLKESRISSMKVSIWILNTQLFVFRNRINLLRILTNKIYK